MDSGITGVGDLLDEGTVGRLLANLFALLKHLGGIKIGCALLIQQGVDCSLSHKRGICKRYRFAASHYSFGDRFYGFCQKRGES